jgi:hypothetical protein
MIHVINNLMSDYDLQLALLEIRIGDTEHPLTVSEIRAELSLRFDKYNKCLNKDSGDNADHKLFQCKILRKSKRR